MLDLDVINSTLQALQSEFSGELNEHNFSADTLRESIDPSDVLILGQRVEDGFAIVAHQVAEERNPFIAGSRELMAKSTSWEPLNGAEIEFDGFGGNVWLVASWQTHHSAAIRTSGFMYAFEIDGNVYPDAMIGSGDTGNDLWRQGVVPSGFSVPTANDWETGPAFVAIACPYVLELVTYLPPGRHTIKLVARQLEVDNLSSSHSVSQVELNAFELWDR